MNGVKHTTYSITQSIKDRGIRCKQYAGKVRPKSQFECECGYAWQARTDAVLGGAGCPSCAGRAPHTIESINKKLKSRGFICIDYAGNQNDKSRWKCQCGHAWSTSGSHVLEKSGCPLCAGKAPYDIDRINKKIAHLGIECIRNSGNVLRKSEFRCENGHTWSAPAISVLKGKGCIVCNGYKPHTLETIDKSIGSRGLNCIRFGGSVHAHSSFKCECGYSWQTSASNVLKGHGCPACAGTIPHTINTVNERIRPRGLECTEYGGSTKHDSIFECECGHSWITNTGDVMRGKSNCPSCSATGFDKEKPAILYYLKVAGGYYKIGITNLTVKERFPLSVDRNKITVIKVWKYDSGQNAYDKEKNILTEFDSQRSVGVNVLTTGNTELFDADVLQLDNGDAMTTHLARNY